MKKLIAISFLAGTVFLISCRSGNTEYRLPLVDHKDLSNLHGFNLLDKFASDWYCGPFQEKDFEMIARYGFNFVRLPMDYRCITVKGEWDKLDNWPMTEVDQAIKLGKKYGIHVCINLHHAPGYCINARGMYSADSSLWTGTKAQEAFVSLWRQMAKRYKGISNDNLSFNLLNEPEGTSKEQYVEVAIRAIEAIRKVDPKRLVMSDGWNVGTEPIVELVPYDVVQMFRGYWPMNLTHYRAGWAGNAHGPEPEWPGNQYLGQYIRSGGEGKTEVPLTLKHVFTDNTPAAIEILRTSGAGDLVVRADGKEIFRKTLDPDKDGVEKERGTGAGIYEKIFGFSVPRGTRELTVHSGGSEWITFGKLWVFLEGMEEDPVKIIPGNVWTDAGIPVLISGGGFVTENAPNADWDSIYRSDHLEPWIKFMKEYNIGIMVGEWGVYEMAPYDVTLKWTEYMLATWREYNLGWAMWNFRGSFGVADADRPGAEFKDVDGVRVDERMLGMLKAAIE